MSQHQQKFKHWIFPKVLRIRQNKAYQVSCVATKCVRSHGWKCRVCVLFASFSSVVFYVYMLGELGDKIYGLPG